MTNRTDPRPGATHPSLAGRDLAIFDLDRTLLPGSSLVHLGRVLVRRRVVPPAALVEFLGRELLFRRRGLSEPGAQRLQDRLLAMARGIEYAPLLPMVEQVGAEVVRQLRPAALRLVRHHQQRGDYCLVLSASPQELVGAVATGLGLDRGVGTRSEVVDGRLTGRLDGPLCHSDGKLARLRDELGVLDLSGAVAYSDAATDLPLLRACGHAVAVNPDRRLRAAAAATGWPILDLA
ncbi:MAG: HAD-IB family hydrolase [Actinobacteria bacterium]|nr:HAD-IB family hydrolase [Actinomycetota bacterium]